jgi:hypothetical protein
LTLVAINRDLRFRSNPPGRLCPVEGEIRVEHRPARALEQGRETDRRRQRRLAGDLPDRGEDATATFSASAISVLGRS